MKTFVGYFIVAYLLFALVLTFYASHYDDIPDFYLSKPTPLIFPHAPDFNQFADVEERKQAFFNYFRPIVDQVNENILQERDTLLAIQQALATTGQLSQYALAVIGQLSQRYDVDAQADIAQQIDILLHRVNIVPSSLALAQAANESGWGSSRFAQEGNNFFGMWCYSEGCGHVPSSRPSGASHEVQAFESPAQSVKAYIHNINTHRAYRSLRNIRARASRQGIALTGELLADGLIQYSQRREAYVEEIKAMIRSNDLDAERLILTTD